MYTSTSPNEKSGPNFSLEIRYLLDTYTDNCYKARVVKKFQTKEETDKFARWKRPKYYQSRTKRFNFIEEKFIAKINIDVSNVSSLITVISRCIQ